MGLGFDQCNKWLVANCPNIQRIAVNSTAKGAMMAAEDESSAAICSDLASLANGLPILYSNIMDSPTNATRFLVRRPDEHQTSTPAHTSTLVF